MKLIRLRTSSDGKSYIRTLIVNEDWEAKSKLFRVIEDSNRSGILYSRIIFEYQSRYIEGELFQRALDRYIDS